MKTEEEINKKIATLFTDFTTKFMDKICDQILENRNEGHWYWLRADQIKNITKDILKDIKGDEEC